MLAQSAPCCRVSVFIFSPFRVTPQDAFDQCFLEVDRIIAKERRGRAGTLKYLVKWNGLPYAEATWELPEDIKVR